MLPVGASLLSLAVCLPLFMYYKKNRRYVLGAVFKGLGTFCALSVALIAALKLDSRCFLAVAALAFHVAADILLEFVFPLGTAFFAAGHLLYTAYFFKVFSVSLPFWICLAVLLMTLSLVFWQWRSRIGKQMPMFIVYGIILSVMTAAAVGCGFPQASTQGTLTALGGAVFFISDALLLQRLLFRTGRFMPWAVMITYDTAQLLLASACLFS